MVLPVQQNELSQVKNKPHGELYKCVFVLELGVDEKRNCFTN
jgi:hypothetical protein